MCAFQGFFAFLLVYLNQDGAKDEHVDDEIDGQGKSK